MSEIDNRSPGLISFCQIQEWEGSLPVDSVKMEPVGIWAASVIPTFSVSLRFPDDWKKKGITLTELLIQNMAFDFTYDETLSHYKKYVIKPREVFYLSLSRAQKSGAVLNLPVEIPLKLEYKELLDDVITAHEDERKRRNLKSKFADDALLLHVPQTLHLVSVLFHRGVHWWAVVRRKSSWFLTNDNAPPECVALDRYIRRERSHVGACIYTASNDFLDEVPLPLPNPLSTCCYFNSVIQGILSIRKLRSIFSLLPADYPLKISVSPTMPESFLAGNLVWFVSKVMIMRDIAR